LFNQEGSAQSFFLRSTQDPSGENARMLFQQAIRSLRVLPSLFPGRALANNELAHSRLEKNVQHTSTLAFVHHISGIQSLLIGKISVDPKSPEAYYHLAGTSYLLLKHASETRIQSTQIQAPRFLAQLDEWSALARPQIQVADRYIQDVAPDH